jgi:hypothetical protein
VAEQRRRQMDSCVLLELHARQLQFEVAAEACCARMMIYF